jgi:hypothetical protein
MPLLPFKRKAANTPDTFNAYIPTHLTDYTSLPPLEDDEAGSRFSGLPTAVRIGAVIVPVVLIIFGAWFVWKFVFGASQTPVQQPADPSITIASARVVSRNAIVIEGEANDVSDGTIVTARLLANDEPIEWADAATVSTTVKQEQIALRMTKSPAWQTSLDQDDYYVVELTMKPEAGKAIVARSKLQVPSQLTSSFFGTEVAAVEPTRTPEPTSEPTSEPTTEPTPEPDPEAVAESIPEPTSEPPAPTSTPEQFIPVPAASTPEPDMPEPEPLVSPPQPASPATPDSELGQSGTPTLKVSFDASALISPTLGSRPMQVVPAGTSLEVLRRTEDWQWYLVPLDEQKSRVGWLYTDMVAITEENRARVPSVKPDSAAVAAGPLHARVFNGGNIRYYPNLTYGTVLGQLHAGQTITLQAKTPDGMWYKVVAPEASGWVHVSLILMDADVLAQVPVSE